MTTTDGGTPRLIADIGGTNARFALVGAGGEPWAVRVLRCKDYPDPVAAVEAYLGGAAVPARPRRGAFAVASPITGDRVAMTNHPWTFSIEDAGRRMGLDAFTVINDFTAVALAIPRLGPGDRFRVGGGEPAPNTPIAVLGAGTGLGVSALVPAGETWLPLTTEGGHVTMAAATDRESAVLELMRRSLGHISAERVISGPGLVNLYRFLSELDGRAPDPSITPDAVTERALGESDPDAAEALEMFCAMLGTVAADLVLSLGARGGVYIAGGIVPKLGDAFADSGFRRRFEDKGRFSGYLAPVPAYVITHELPAFLGLGELARTL